MEIKTMSEELKFLITLMIVLGAVTIAAFITLKESDYQTCLRYSQPDCAQLINNKNK